MKAMKSVAIQVIPTNAEEEQFGVEEIKLTPELQEFLSNNPICGRSDYSDLPGAKKDVHSSWRTFQHYPRRESLSISENSHPSSMSSPMSQEKQSKLNKARLLRQERLEKQQLKKQELAAKRQAVYRERMRLSMLEKATLDKLTAKDDAGSGEEAKVVIISSPQKKSPIRSRDGKKLPKLGLKIESSLSVTPTASEKEGSPSAINGASSEMKEEKGSDCSPDVLLRLEALICEIASVNYIPPKKLNLDKEEEWILKKLFLLKDVDNLLEENTNTPRHRKTLRQSSDLLDKSVSSSSSPDHPPLPILTTLVKFAKAPECESPSEASDPGTEIWSVASSTQHNSVKALADSSTERRARRRKKRINYAEWEDGDDYAASVAFGDDQSPLKSSNPVTGNSSSKLESNHQGKGCDGANKQISTTDIFVSENMDSKGNEVSSSVKEASLPQREGHRVASANLKKTSKKTGGSEETSALSKANQSSTVVKAQITSMNSTQNLPVNVLPSAFHSASSVNTNLHATPASFLQQPLVINPTFNLAPSPFATAPHNCIQSNTTSQIMPPNFLLSNPHNMSRQSIAPTLSTHTIPGLTGAFSPMNSQYDNLCSQLPVLPSAFPVNCGNPSILPPSTPLLLAATNQTVENPQPLQSGSLLSPQPSMQFGLPLPPVSAFCVNLEPAKSASQMQNPYPNYLPPSYSAASFPQAVNTSPWAHPSAVIHPKPTQLFPPVHCTTASASHLLNQIKTAHLNSGNPSNSGPGMKLVDKTREQFPPKGSESISYQSQYPKQVTTSSKIESSSRPSCKRKLNDDFNVIKSMLTPVSKQSSKAPSSNSQGSSYRASEQPPQKVSRVTESAKHKSLMEVNNMLSNVHSLLPKKSVETGNGKPKSSSNHVQPNQVVTQRSEVAYPQPSYPPTVHVTPPAFPRLPNPLSSSSHPTPNQRVSPGQLPYFPHPSPMHSPGAHQTLQQLMQLPHPTFQNAVPQGNLRRPPPASAKNMSVNYNQLNSESKAGGNQSGKNNSRPTTMKDALAISKSAVNAHHAASSSSQHERYVSQHIQDQRSMLQSQMNRNHRQDRGISQPQQPGLGSLREANAFAQFNLPPDRNFPRNSLLATHPPIRQNITHLQTALGQNKISSRDARPNNSAAAHNASSSHFPSGTQSRREEGGSKAIHNNLVHPNKTATEATASVAENMPHMATFPDRETQLKSIKKEQTLRSDDSRLGHESPPSAHLSSKTVSSNPHILHTSRLGASASQASCFPSPAAPASSQVLHRGKIPGPPPPMSVSSVSDLSASHPTRRPSALERPQDLHVISTPVESSSSNAASSPSSSASLTLLKTSGSKETRVATGCHEMGNLTDASSSVSKALVSTSPLAALLSTPSSSSPSSLTSKPSSQPSASGSTAWTVAARDRKPVVSDLAAAIKAYKLRREKETAMAKLLKVSNIVSSSKQSASSPTASSTTASSTTASSTTASSTTSSSSSISLSSISSASTFAPPTSVAISSSSSKTLTSSSSSRDRKPVVSDLAAALRAYKLRREKEIARTKWQKISRIIASTKLPAPSPTTGLSSSSSVLTTRDRKPVVADLEADLRAYKLRKERESAWAKWQKMSKIIANTNFSASSTTPVSSASTLAPPSSSALSLKTSSSTLSSTVITRDRKPVVSDLAAALRAYRLQGREKETSRAKWHKMSRIISSTELAPSSSSSSSSLSSSLPIPLQSSSTMSFSSGLRMERSCTQMLINIKKEAVEMADESTSTSTEMMSPPHSDMNREIIPPATLDNETVRPEASLSFAPTEVSLSSSTLAPPMSFSSTPPSGMEKSLKKLHELASNEAPDSDKASKSTGNISVSAQLNFDTTLSPAQVDCIVSPKIMDTSASYVTEPSPQDLEGDNSSAIKPLETLNTTTPVDPEKTLNYPANRLPEIVSVAVSEGIVAMSEPSTIPLTTNSSSGHERPEIVGDNYDTVSPPSPSIHVTKELAIPSGSLVGSKSVCRPSSQIVSSPEIVNTAELSSASSEKITMPSSSLPSFLTNTQTISRPRAEIVLTSASEHSLSTSEPPSACLLATNPDSDEMTTEVIGDNCAVSLSSSTSSPCPIIQEPPLDSITLSSQSICETKESVVQRDSFAESELICTTRVISSPEIVETTPLSLASSEMITTSSSSSPSSSLRDTQAVSIKQPEMVSFGAASPASEHSLRTSEAPPASRLTANSSPLDLSCRVMEDNNCDVSFPPSSSACLVIQEEPPHDSVSLSPQVICVTEESVVQRDSVSLSSQLICVTKESVVQRDSVVGSESSQIISLSSEIMTTPSSSLPSFPTDTQMATTSSFVVQQPQSSFDFQVTLGQSDLISDLIKVKTELSEDASNEPENEMLHSGIILSGGHNSSSENILLDTFIDQHTLPDNVDHCSAGFKLPAVVPHDKVSESNGASPRSKSTNQNFSTESLSQTIASSSSLFLNVPTCNASGLATSRNEDKIECAKSKAGVVSVSIGNDVGQSKPRFSMAVVIPPPTFVSAFRPTSSNIEKDMPESSLLSFPRVPQNSSEELDAWQVGSSVGCQDDASIDSIDLFSGIASSTSSSSVTASSSSVTASSSSVTASSSSVTAPISESNTTGHYTVAVISQNPNASAYIDSKDNVCAELKQEITTDQKLHSNVVEPPPARFLHTAKQINKTAEQTDITASKSDTFAPMSVIVSSFESGLSGELKSVDSVSTLEIERSRAVVDYQETITAVSKFDNASPERVAESSEPGHRELGQSTMKDQGKSTTTQVLHQQISIPPPENFLLESRAPKEDQASEEPDVKLETEDWVIPFPVSKEILSNTLEDAVVILSDEDGDDGLDDEIIIFDDDDLPLTMSSQPTNNANGVMALSSDATVFQHTDPLPLVQGATANEDAASTISSLSAISGGSNKASNRSIQALGSWSKEEVTAWLRKEKLDKICLNLSNLDGPGLQRMAFECHYRDHEVFYDRIKRTLGLTMFQSLVIIRSLKSLIKQDDENEIL